MKEYFEIRIKGNNYYWHTVELLESNEKSETFLFKVNNEKKILNKNEFSKRELSVNIAHLERLGFYDNEKKQYVSKKGIFVEPIHLHKKESLTIATEEFLGYVIYKEEETEKLRKIYSKLRNDFFNGIIVDKTIPQRKLKCFYSINHLLDKLKNYYDFPFNEQEIVG